MGRIQCFDAVLFHVLDKAFNTPVLSMLVGSRLLNVDRRFSDNFSLSQVHAASLAE
jgi:hypothetical protein